MARGTRLGEFELIVLVALLRLGEEAYGVAVLHEIQEQTERPVAIGSIYKTLERLKRKNLIESRLGDPTPVRGGRAKQYFVVTGAGRAAMEGSIRDLSRMVEGLDLGWGSV